MGDLEVAKATRTKEKADFEDAEAEMTKAIKALNSAIEVLGEATKDHKKGVLIAMRARLNGGMAALAEQQVALSHAVELGKRFLEKADATFLTRLLTGDVPTADWKKLNRKATFKMAYKARSFKIQSVLKKLHQTFDLNLKDAKAKEAAAQADYDKLKANKQGMLDAAREALTKMESENGAKGMSRQDAKDELDALTKQVADDKKFIADTEASLATKKKEWKERQTLRAGELEAISKAIYILHNDDARDLMKRSLESQGFFFVQVGAETHRAQAAKGAVAVLKDAARRSGDDRLLSLVASLADPSVKTQFKPVIDAIDKMIAILKDNEKKDLEIKQTCEEDRMSDTRKAILAGRAIDDMTDKMTSLTSEIKTLNEEIEKLLAQHKETKEELDAATKIRKDENAAWKITDKDDEDAAETVASAATVLSKFYKDNNLVFVQKTHQPAVEAGEAPPPPPPTWEGGYGGKTGESQGIVAIMEMIHEDILADKAKAEKEEHEAQEAYDKLKEDSEHLIKSLTEEIEEQEGVRGDKETDKVQTKDQRATEEGDLNSVLKLIADINPNCEYYTVNYRLRASNRQVEIDGLQKAKAILKGASFEDTPSGFLQRHK